MIHHHACTVRLLALLVMLLLAPHARGDEQLVHGVENIQRTMRLLATSTPDQPNTVRILFYGQSITKQDWWLQVVEHLRKQYPHANIIAENRAIGGFAAQRLIDTAERDITTFYPDLVIFHVFGDHSKYEQIIRLIRAQTTAEILLQTDHLGAAEPADRPDNKWKGFINNRFLPAVAEHYDCALVDVRSGWKAHLVAAKQPAQSLLRDKIHLNEAGCNLMARQVIGALKHAPTQPSPAEQWVSEIQVETGKDTLITGNRVVALLPTDRPSGVVRVLIDDQSPSSLPSVYRFSRPNEGPGVDWPWTVCAPFQINSDQPLTAEEWTITVLEGDVKRFRFRVEGSVTGPDGEGWSDQPFRSTSGRVLIQPQHWWRATPRGVANPVKPGYAWTFRSAPMAADLITSANTDAEIMLASGLPNTQHTLRLQSDKPLVQRLRIHRPPLTPQGDDNPVASRLTPSGAPAAD